jgi:hypothetical protein
MPNINLYAGEATPQNIRLRAVFEDLVAWVLKTIYLYPMEPHTLDTSRLDLYLYQGEATPSNIRLRDIFAPLITLSPWNIRLYDPAMLASGIITPPYVPPSYYGILRRWAGSWVKALLKTYFGGSFVTKPLKRWDGSGWKLVDSGG